jgi:ribosomal protein S3AE
MAKAVLQKNWYEIQAPDIFDEDTVTETPAEKDSQVVGRTVKESLNDLLEASDKYYADVTLKVTEVEGNKAFTEISEMSVSSEFVSRMIQTDTDRFDLVEDFETSDGETVRVKVVGATLRKASNKAMKNARKEISDVIEENASSQTYEEFMENIFTDKVQEEFRDRAEKIYPFRELEIRKTELR